MNELTGGLQPGKRFLQQRRITYIRPDADFRQVQREVGGFLPWEHQRSVEAGVDQTVERRGGAWRKGVSRQRPVICYRLVGGARS